MSNDYLASRPVLCRQNVPVTIILVGCGGTGSYLAPRLVDIARLLTQRGTPVHLTFVDPDRIEAKNCARQNFLSREIGLFKAEVLALRYSLARGLDIQAITAPFAAARTLFSPYSGQVELIIGAVDNAAARQSIHDLVREQTTDPFNSTRVSLWWVDTGNERYTGQVLLGNTANPKALAHAFDLPDWCVALPLPTLQHPELLMPPALPQPTASCAERLATEEQSLLINHRVAVEAADMVAQLLLSQSLRRYATYVDGMAGTTTSRYTTPENIATFLPAESPKTETT